MLNNKLIAWELISSAWEKDIKNKLRVIHLKRNYYEPEWKKVRKNIRIVTDILPNEMPVSQAWNVGRARWNIENSIFNELTSDYSLEHNYHHSTTSIVALLVIRSLALDFSKAYYFYATARSKNAPPILLDWFQSIFLRDWVFYLACDIDLAVPDSG